MADASETFTVRIVTEADESLAKTAELERQIQEVIDALRWIKQNSRQSFEEIAEGLKAANEQTKQFKPGVIAEGLRRIKEEGQGLPGAASSIKTVGDATQKAGDQAQQSVSKFTQLGSILKYVFGAVLGITAISVIRDFIGWIGKAAEAGVQFAKAAFQMEIGVRALQRAGVEITIKEVYENLDKLSNKFKIFTTKDLVVGAAAFLNLIRDMGFTKDQIFELQDSIATLAVVNGRAMDEVQRTVALALSSGYTEGLQRLGVSINRVTIAEKAAQLGWDKGYTALTEQQRAYATYLLILEKTSVYQEDLAEYYKTLPGQIEKTNTAIKEQTNAIGSLLAPLALLVAKLKQAALAWFALFSPIVMVGRVLAVVGRSMKYSADILSLFSEELQPVTNALKQLIAIGNQIRTAITNPLKELAKNGGDALDRLAEKSERWAKIIELAKGYFSDLQKLMTGKPLETMGDTEVGGKTDAEQAAEFMEAMTDEIDQLEKDFQDDSKEAWEDYLDDVYDITLDGMYRLMDLWRDYQRQLQDIDRQLTLDIGKENRDMAIDIAKIDTDETRKNEEAYRDYYRDLSDIDRDASEKKAKTEREYRNRELTEEAKFQEQMRQLREDFLFDLEDAVRERDARQIIRLIRQYNLEKQQRTREHELGKKERSQDLAEELADIERQRQIKKQERAIELSDKLADIARDAAYERQERARENVEKIAELKAEAELKRQEALREYEQDKADLDADQARRKADRLEDYGREIEDLKRHHLDRQVEVMAGLIQEYNITESMLKTINDLMLSYYGPSGAYMQTLIAFYTAWSQMASSVLFPNSTPMTIQKETEQPTIPGYAKGGTILATRPTVAMFGEEEPEFVTITPLSKMGKDANQMLSGIPGTMLGQTGGKVEVALWLSPDLESRIVNTALNETAKVIVSVNKLKVQKGI